jgi:hypothetical protein
MDKWLQQTRQFLIDTWGLDKSFADQIALFVAYLLQYGIYTSINSGWRSPDQQAELSRRYVTGDASIIVPPAAISMHSTTSWGRPASRAVDISTRNPSLAARIADCVGIGAGYYYRVSDPVHFYAK